MDGDPTGLVLAGGASTRMGRPKPTIELAGSPLLLHPLRAVEAAGLNPAVVAKPDSELPPLAVPVFREPQQPRHPLLGIVSAISGRIGAEIAGPAVVVACDMPFTPAALLEWLAAQAEPLIVCEGGGRLQPLLGRYDPSVEPELSAAVEAGTSAQDAVRALGARVVSGAELSNFGPPERVLFNVNDPSDLAEAERMAGE
jgi:molybdopterin-guanine dinucleotide biosynthesis protein A